MGGLINPLETMSSLPFKQQPHKMVKHVSPVCGVGVWGVTHFYNPQAKLDDL